MLIDRYDLVKTQPINQLLTECQSGVDQDVDLVLTECQSRCSLIIDKDVNLIKY